MSAYIIGTVAGVGVLGPSVLAVFGSTSAGNWAYIAVDTGLCVIMLVITIVGIRITARTQIGMAVNRVHHHHRLLDSWGSFWCCSHHPGTFPITRGWFSLTGIGGKGSLAAGLLISVYAYSLWDGTLYVNEEVKHRRVNPGKAAVYAVALLMVIYTLTYVGLQGVVSPAKLQANSSTAMVYVASAMGGGGWAKVMALSIALSVTAATGTGIVLASRIVYGMASHRTLPPVLGSVSPRFRTPVVASVVVGVLIIAAILGIYRSPRTVQTIFTYVVSVSGMLSAAFYILTALATIAYYRRRVFSQCMGCADLRHPPPRRGRVPRLDHSQVDTIRADGTANWSLVGIMAAGVIMMFFARFVLRSPFFQIPLESAASARER